MLWSGRDERGRDGWAMVCLALSPGGVPAACRRGSESHPAAAWRGGGGVVSTTAAFTDHRLLSVAAVTDRRPAAPPPPHLAPHLLPHPSLTADAPPPTQTRSCFAEITDAVLRDEKAAAGAPFCYSDKDPPSPFDRYFMNALVVLSF